MKKHNIIILTLLGGLLLTSCGDASIDKATVINSSLDTSKEIHLNIVGPYLTSPGLEDIGANFEKKYPNVSINYEYIQDYNNLLPQRLAETNNNIDLFISDNIQAGTTAGEKCSPYALNIYSDSRVDLSDCNEGLVKNSDYNGVLNTNYGVSMGGEIRGLYVNKTILAKYNLSVPRTLSEFMNCLKVLKENKLMPLFGNPGIFGQQLLYPYICNLIANSSNYTEIYQKVNNIEDGVSSLFTVPLQEMYDFMSNYYFDYHYVENNYPVYQNCNGVSIKTAENTAKGFFNIAQGENGADDYKRDDIGVIPFINGTYTSIKTYQEVKENFNSQIEYEFIMALTSEEGGFVYLSPTSVLAINKNSANLAWCIEFYNYFFTKSVNKLYAEHFNCIPNIKDKTYFADKFTVPANRISDVGQVTFKYNFFGVMNATLIAISKGNNPDPAKNYMDFTDPDNPKLYSFEHYMSICDDNFKKVKESFN